MEMHGEFLVNIIEFYRIDQNNPGDLFSNPSRYFFKDKETTKIDVDHIKKTSWKQDDTLIVGGGGLIGNENFESLVERISKSPDEQLLIDILETNLKIASNENKKILQKWKSDIQLITLDVLQNLNRKVGPRILWGVGYNSKEKEIDSYILNYPSYITQFDLVGVRDWDTDYRWVPCASCMHPAFDKEYEIKNEIVWFEHKKRLIETKVFDVKPAPRMLNTGQNIEQIIEFLGSAETVVTNSYHGVYWATLLNRKVICIPWGSKFNMFKHTPTMASEKNWHEKINEAISYPNALEECREANTIFYEDVLNLINTK